MGQRGSRCSRLSKWNANVSIQLMSLGWMRLSIINSFWPILCVKPFTISRGMYRYWQCRPFNGIDFRLPYTIRCTQFSVFQLVCSSLLLLALLLELTKLTKKLISHNQFLALLQCVLQLNESVQNKLQLKQSNCIP